MVRIMTQNEHKNLIVELAKLFKPRIYVELGIASGYVFNSIVPYVQNYAFGIDINLNKYNYMYDELPPFMPGDYIKPGNNYYKSVQVIQKTTDEAAKLWPQNLTIDLLFIDADHKAESVRQDFITWSKFVTPGTGLILLHDTYPISQKYLKPGYCNDAWKVVDELFSYINEGQFLDYQESWGETDNPFTHDPFRDIFEIVTLPGPHAGLSIIRKRGDKHLYWMESK